MTKLIIGLFNAQKLNFKTLQGHPHHPLQRRDGQEGLFQIIIGDPAPTKPVGAVKIQSGRAKVGFHDHVEIQGEFEVCSGAELEILPVNE